MNILVIHGSMRKGNTYALTQEIVKRLKVKPDVECMEISVKDLELPFCGSCHVCFAKGEENCPHYEIMRRVEAALLECDGVILSGTTYMWSLNAAMKNLLDHLAYMFHRPALFGKYGMVIATSAGAGEKGAAKYLKTVLGQFGINGAVILTQNAKQKSMVSVEKLEKNYDKAAERFYKTVTSKRFIHPALKSIAVHNAFRAMAQSGFTDSERDTAFWNTPEMNKAYPVKAGAFKRMMGAIIYGMVKGLTKMIGRGYNNKKAKEVDAKGNDNAD